MSREKAPSDEPENPEHSKFMQLARALFRVDKRDVTTTVAATETEKPRRGRPRKAEGGTVQ